MFLLLEVRPTNVAYIITISTKDAIVYGDDDYSCIINKTVEEAEMALVGKSTISLSAIR